MSPKTRYPWYYRIELAPGEFTDGRPRPNVCLTRQLLRSVELAGCSCLDIGTQEAMVPTLAVRAGAADVVAYDREDRDDAVGMVRDAYGVSFDYLGGHELVELPGILDERGTRYFDLVVFSGVFYHLLGPFGLLTVARGLCRQGGLFLIESVMFDKPGYSLEINVAGKVYGPRTNYFVPTVGGVDYLLRMLGLRPLRAVQLRCGKETHCRRVALLCRSEDEPCPRDPADDWAVKDCHRQCFLGEGQFDFTAMRRAGRSEIGLQPAEPGVLELDDRELYEQLHDHPPLRPDKDRCSLMLDATF